MELQRVLFCLWAIVQGYLWSISLEKEKQSSPHRPEMCWRDSAGVRIGPYEKTDPLGLFQAFKALFG